MQDQHKKISGYRDLNQEEIDFMNRIKAFGPELEKLCRDLSEYHENQLRKAERVSRVDGESEYYDRIVNTYTPDNWCIIHLNLPGGTPHYRVAASWSGSFTQGKSWKFNSGIERWCAVERNGATIIRFAGTSGSVYECYSNAEGADWYLQSIIDSYIKESPAGGFQVVQFDSVKNIIPNLQF